MEYHPPLHLGVVAFEKVAFGSPSTVIANFTYFSLLFKIEQKLRMRQFLRENQTEV